MADDEHVHAHGDESDEDEHDHGELVFEASHVDEATLGSLRILHPALADVLILAKRFASLSAEEKALLLEAQGRVETFADWMPGFHDASDRCAACESPVTPLFEDRFKQGALRFAAFVDDVPVHARKECIESFKRKHPRRAPQLIDKLRRDFTLDRERPSARMSQFFQHDVLAHGKFGLEDWANSVAEANAEKMSRSMARDIERTMRYVHRTMFH